MSHQFLGPCDLGATPSYLTHSLACIFSLQFESDVQKLKIERLRSFKAIEDYLEAFERKRTQNLRVRMAVYAAPLIRRTYQT